MSNPKTSSMIVFLCLLGFISTAVAITKQVSCHFSEDPTFRKGKLGDGVQCKSVTIPSGLCNACPMKPIDLATGFFPDCESVYDLESTTCRRKLKRYSRLNPCDTQRSEQVADFNERNIKKLDYFVYALCEGCCDCIALDSSPSDVGQLDLDRYNCPDHTLADICKVLPEVGHYRRPKDPPAPADEDIPDICGQDLRQWKDGAGRSGVRFTEFETPVRDHLTRVVNTLQCRRSSTWNMCFALENSQDRLDTTPEE